MVNRSKKFEVISLRSVMLIHKYFHVTEIILYVHI